MDRDICNSAVMFRCGLHLNLYMIVKKSLWLKGSNLIHKDNYFCSNYSLNIMNKLSLFRRWASAHSSWGFVLVCCQNDVYSQSLYQYSKGTVDLACCLNAMLSRFLAKTVLDDCCISIVPENGGKTKMTRCG